jgi:hypothetical protein
MRVEPQATTSGERLGFTHRLSHIYASASAALSHGWQRYGDQPHSENPDAQHRSSLMARALRMFTMIFGS